MVIMANEKSSKMKLEFYKAKTSENYLSVKIECWNFFDSFRFLDASLDKLFATLTNFPSLDASGMANELISYRYEKGKTKKSLFEPLKIGREDYFLL